MASGYTAQPFPLANPSLQAGPKKVQPKAFERDLSVRLACPECPPYPPQEIVEEFSSGDLVCGGCGLVLGDRIVDTRSEWRTFANDEGDDPSRVGQASNPMDGPETFETSISFRDGNTGLSRELQRAARSTSTKTDKSLSTAYSLISEHSDRINLGKTVTDIAKQLFKRASEEQVLKGKPVEAIVASCIFIACRMGRVPRTFREICDLTGVPKKLLGQCYKILERAFEVKTISQGATSATDGSGVPAGGLPTPAQVTAQVIAAAANSTGTEITSAPILPLPSADFVPVQHNDSELQTSTISTIIRMLPRYISNLGGSNWRGGFSDACAHVLRKSYELHLIDGRSPLTVIGVLLYFMTHLWGVGKTAKEICEVVDTTEGTVRARYRQLFERREELVPKDWVEKGKADLARLPK